MITWALKKILGTSHEREVKRLRPKVEAINALEPKISALSDAQLVAKTAEFKQKLENGATLDDILVEAFAVCREGGKRALKMRHYDVQLIGGMVLHNGSIAEMRTGEGKTLVATLACYLNALEGKGVHVVTVNDYLAKRDAEWMGKLYGFLGLSTGTVVHSGNERDKRGAYLSDITYGQNNEFGFDYLRDNMKFSALEYAQRELNFAIVDEVDSILIDEARTPLIISGQGEKSSRKYAQINLIVPRLRKDEHFVVDEKGHSVALTDDGVDEAQRLIGVSNLYDTANLESLHILNQCLRAHALYRRDVNYLVSHEGKVLIIDEFTGRVLPGRRWSDGLHQAVEAKEEVEIQEETRTMATITFQNLFRLYKKLGGMTGTADTEAEEFHSTYNLSVTTIPTNKPIRRVDHDDLVYKNDQQKTTAVINELLEYHERGQPVLVGTVSVEKSNAIANALKKQKIPHAVLNAKQHEKEAYVVAQAGRKGAITVSTNMAGRGTDILLGGSPEMLARLEFKEQGKDEHAEPDAFAELVKKFEVSCKKEGEEVRELGGLHILGTERHESRRIDNQLRGRAGRQGDPGSSRFYLSLDDDLMRIFAGDKVKALMERMGMPDDEPIVAGMVTRSIGDAQSKVEGRNFDIRKNLLEYDDVMSEQRKTVYKIRQQLLLGIYTPEKLDDEGKATGKLREIKTLPRLQEEVTASVRDLVIHYGTPLQNTDGLPPPKTVDEVRELFSLPSLREDIYQFFGYKIEFKTGDEKKPKEVYQRLLAELASSVTQQRERVLDLMDGIVGAVVEESCPSNKPSEDWDWKTVREGFQEHFGQKAQGEIERFHTHSDLAQELYRQAEEIFETKEKEIGTDLLLRVFRREYLREIDSAWVEHLTSMEHLRDGIGLRGYGQRDPKQEYKKEGYDLFITMMAATSGNVVTELFKTRKPAQRELEQAERALAQEHERQLQQMHTQHGTEVDGVEDGADPADPAAARARASARPAPRPVPVQAPVRREGAKIGRNDPCPCGSGQKFKKCHGAALEDGTDAEDANP
jgi:preprotein translocase subunit SecA